MRLTSYSKLVYLDHPTVLNGLIELGELHADEMMQVAEEAQEAIAELEVLWPPERIKEELLKEQRRRCEWVQKKIQTLETENKEARAKGVSYKARANTTRHIEVLKKLFAEYREKGIEFKKKNTTLKDWVKPKDLEFIHSHGFESHLKHATM